MGRRVCREGAGPWTGPVLGAVSKAPRQGLARRVDGSPVEGQGRQQLRRAAARCLDRRPRSRCAIGQAMELIRCPTHPDTAIEFSTADGLLVECCVKCDRRAARRCIDCAGAPRTPLAHRCTPCNRAHANRRQCATRARTCRNPECGAPVELGSKRQYCRQRCKTRKKYLDFAKRMKRDRKYRRRKLASKRAWRKANPMVMAMHKRTGRLNGTWGYRTREAFLAAQEEQNLRPGRGEKKRAWAREHQTMKGRGELPRCRNCGTPVEYSGLGAVPVHPGCRRRP